MTTCAAPDCEATFTVRAQNPGQRYCSMACYNRTRARAWAHCVYVPCKRWYRRWTRRQRYCSLSCAAAATNHLRTTTGLRRRRDRTCQGCGVTFRGFWNALYCSRRCYQQHGSFGRSARRQQSA